MNRTNVEEKWSNRIPVKTTVITDIINTKSNSRDMGGHVRDFGVSVLRDEAE